MQALRADEMALERLALYAVLWSAVSGVLGSSDADAAAKAFGTQNVPGWLDKIDNPLVQTAFYGAKTMAERIQKAQSVVAYAAYQPDGVGPGGAVTMASAPGSAHPETVVNTVPAQEAPAKKTVAVQTEAFAATMASPSLHPCPRNSHLTAADAGMHAGAAAGLAAGALPSTHKRSSRSPVAACRHKQKRPPCAASRVSSACICRAGARAPPPAGGAMPASCVARGDDWRGEGGFPRSPAGG